MKSSGLSCILFFSLGKFLADNIVGSVVVFSLLFWIPFSILVHCVVGCNKWHVQQFNFSFFISYESQL